MSNEQKNEQKQKKTSLFSSRRLRHGGFATLLVVAVIVITILLNIVISTLDNVWGLSYDLSSNRLYTISEQTERVVSAIDEPVHIYALMQTGSESQTVENLLENYRRLAPDYITVTVVDPIQNPHLCPAVHQREPFGQLRHRHQRGRLALPRHRPVRHV